MTEAMKALIIDDEPLARDVVRTFLAKHTGISVIGECANGLDALNAIEELSPNLVFLDVQMPDLNGFEVLRELRTDKKPAVIFTTAFDQFAVKAFEVNAIGYLLKPFGQAAFDACVVKAMTLFQQSLKPAINTRLQQLLEDYEQWKQDSAKGFLSRILVKESKKAFFVKSADVLYFEADGDYIAVHVEERKHLIHERLQVLEKRLNPRQFIRIHRSVIVNIDAILEMHPHFNGEYLIVLRNGDKLKLSRTYKDNLKHLDGLP